MAIIVDVIEEKEIEADPEKEDIIEIDHKIKGAQALSAKIGKPNNLLKMSKKLSNLNKRMNSKGKNKTLRRVLVHLKKEAHQHSLIIAIAKMNKILHSNNLLEKIHSE